MSIPDSNSLPPLEERFLPPEGWRWHSFRNPQGKTLRFGTVSPKSRIPHAVVVCLPGLSEFGEKYFELARDLLDRNLSFWILDWQGQGGSDRHFASSGRRHSTGFQQDVADLHYFIMEYVKHSAVHPDVGRIPLVMLGHSLGGNIGLHYMHEYPDVFNCAALNAPMLGICAIKMPLVLAQVITAMVSLPFGGLYAYGESDWKESWRGAYEDGPFSSDPARSRIHNAWCRHDSRLQAGGVTYRWVFEACRSCYGVQKKNYLESIKTPVMIHISGKDEFVDNEAIRSAALRLPDCTLIDNPHARHETLMERDEIRNGFLNAFDNLVKTCVIDRPESLKPF